MGKSSAGGMVTGGRDAALWFGRAELRLVASERMCRIGEPREACRVLPGNTA
jgi:hypothetical protein